MARLPAGLLTETRTAVQSGVRTYSFTFAAERPEDVFVDVADAPTDRRLFEAVLNVAGTGGSVRFLTSAETPDALTLTAGAAVRIYRDTEVRRATALPRTGFASARVVERELAHNEHVVEELTDRVERHDDIITDPDEVRALLTPLLERDVKAFARVGQAGPDAADLAPPAADALRGAAQAAQTTFTGTALTQIDGEGRPHETDLGALDRGLSVQDSGASQGAFRGVRTVNFLGRLRAAVQGDRADITVEDPEEGGDTPLPPGTIEIPGVRVDTTLAANVDIVRTQGTMEADRGGTMRDQPLVWSPWTEILAAPAVTAAQAGDLLVIGEAHYEIQEDTTGGGDRAIVEVRIKRARTGEADTFPSDQVVYGPRNVGSGVQQDFEDASQAADSELVAVDVAEEGDVYSIEARVIYQRADTKTLRFPVTSTELPGSSARNHLLLWRPPAVQGPAGPAGPKRSPSEIMSLARQALADTIAFDAALREVETLGAPFQWRQGAGGAWTRTGITLPADDNDQRLLVTLTDRGVSPPVTYAEHAFDLGAVRSHVADLSQPAAPGSSVAFTSNDQVFRFARVGNELVVAADDVGDYTLATRVSQIDLRAEARRTSSDRWPKSKLPADTAYTGDLPEAKPNAVEIDRTGLTAGDDGSFPAWHEAAADFVLASIDGGAYFAWTYDPTASSWSVQPTGKLLEVLNAFAGGTWTDTGAGATEPMLEDTFLRAEPAARIDAGWTFTPTLTDITPAAAAGWVVVRVPAATSELDEERIRVVLHDTGQPLIRAVELTDPAVVTLGNDAAGRYYAVPIGAVPEDGDVKLQTLAPFQPVRSRLDLTTGLLRDFVPASARTQANDGRAVVWDEGARRYALAALPHSANTEFPVARPSIPLPTLTTRQAVNTLLDTPPDAADFIVSDTVHTTGEFHLSVEATVASRAANPSSTDANLGFVRGKANQTASDRMIAASQVLFSTDLQEQAAYTTGNRTGLNAFRLAVYRLATRVGTIVVDLTRSSTGQVGYSYRWELGSVAANSTGLNISLELRISFSPTDGTATGAGGSSTFTGLTDTPSAVTAGEVVAGNAAGGALEFRGLSTKGPLWARSADLPTTRPTGAAGQAGAALFAGSDNKWTGAAGSPTGSGEVAFSSQNLTLPPDTPSAQVSGLWISAFIGTARTGMDGADVLQGEVCIPWGPGVVTSHSPGGGAYGEAVLTIHKRAPTEAADAGKTIRVALNLHENTSGLQLQARWDDTSPADEVPDANTYLEVRPAGVFLA